MTKRKQQANTKDDSRIDWPRWLGIATALMTGLAALMDSLSNLLKAIGAG